MKHVHIGRGDGYFRIFRVNTGFQCAAKIKPLWPGPGECVFGGVGKEGWVEI